VRVQAFMQSDGMRNIVGYEGQRTVREHLQGLDETRANRMGGTRSHYYGSARKATEYFIEGEDVVISVAQVGMRLHFYGGTVEAGKNSSYATGSPTKYLTIPAAPEAYGRRASDFPDLIIVWGRGGKPVGLAIAEEANLGSLYMAVTRSPMLTKRPKTTPGKVMFWLKERVTMQADRSVLPTEDELGENIAGRLGKAIARRFEGKDAEAGAGADEGGGI
jgi:hypothetical protein